MDTQTETTTSADQLATLMADALRTARAAGYQAGRYTAGAGDDATERAKLDTAQAGESASAQAMWQAFYTYASAGVTA